MYLCWARHHHPGPLHLTRLHIPSHSVLIYTCVLDKEASISGSPLDYSDEEMADSLARIFVRGLKK
jgi:hypothetical protein